MENLLAEAALRAALLAVLLWLVIRYTHVQSVHAQHRLWTIVLLVMLALPWWLSAGMQLPLPLLPALPASLKENFTTLTFERIAERTPAMRGHVNAVSTPQALPQSIGASAPPTSKVAQWHWRQWLLALYGIGVAFLLVRLLAGLWHVRRLVSNAQPLAALGDNVYASDACAAPVTVGWLRPLIVLPAADWSTWPAAKLAVVLAHEREHIRRRDRWVQFLALLNRAVFWFHPLAWWLVRKLDELAEAACDEAVVQRGHNNIDYADYLIELARSVQQAGGRVHLLGSAITGSSLARRIDTILHTSPSQPITRARTLLVGTLCVSLIALVCACRFVRANKLAPGQPTMNELLHRRAQSSIQGERERQALEDEVKQLTPERAQTLLAELKTKPEDRQLRYKLIRYYQHIVDVQGLDALVLWYIEHQPEIQGVGGINPAWDRAGYEKGKALWLAQLKRKPVPVKVYQNAARFFMGVDEPLAEKILLEARQVHPVQGQNGNPYENWNQDLGRNYAMTLLGAVGPLTAENVFREVSMAKAHNDYAKTLQAKLATSDDVEVLIHTAGWLWRDGSRWMFGRRKDSLDFDPIALAQTLNERALTLQPDAVRALEQRARMQDIAAMHRMQGATFKQLSPVDQMLSFRFEFQSISSQIKDEQAAKAQAMLALAKVHSNEPEANNTTHIANLVLGQHALNRKDKRQAVQHLLAACAVKKTDWLHYGYINVNLARQLIDWGEREAVAQYLEKCAPLTQKRSYDLSLWAQEIRQGKNPDLLPVAMN